METEETLRDDSPRGTGDGGSSRDPQTERRTSIRYPISKNLHYTMSGGSECRDYEGIILNMSTDGLLFSAENIPALGERLELLIRWPWRQGKSSEYMLVIEGKVVRATGNMAAVSFESLGFRADDARPLSAADLLRIMQV